MRRGSHRLARMPLRLRELHPSAEPSPEAPMQDCLASPLCSIRLPPGLLCLPCLSPPRVESCSDSLVRHGSYTFVDQPVFVGFVSAMGSEFQPGIESFAQQAAGQRNLNDRDRATQPVLLLGLVAPAGECLHGQERTLLFMQ